MSLQLSVCIPTYNFGAYIGATLESIIRQATEEVEIVVVDGASTDDTPAVVAKYQESFPRLKYIRRPVRGGFDRDIALTADYADAPYCWFFSADDLMLDGAIAKVIARLPYQDDVILVETMFGSLHGIPLRDYPNFSTREERSFNLSDPAERLEYFALANNTQPFFSFCSAVVFRRDRWLAAQWDQSYLGSCWAHVVRLFSLLPSGLRVRHLPGTLMMKRTGNDSFAADGLANRVRIGIDGYLQIAEKFFGAESAEWKHVRRALRNEYKLIYMLSAKIETLARNQPDQLELLDRLFGRVYDSRLLNFAYRRAPRWAWSILAAVRRFLKRFVPP